LGEILIYLNKSKKFTIQFSNKKNEKLNIPSMGKMSSRKDKAKSSDTEMLLLKNQEDLK
jgi:hypothetical protein